jgi:hypothetical protein
MDLGKCDFWKMEQNFFVSLIPASILTTLSHGEGCFLDLGQGGDFLLG